uniref:Uncharacterized protein n=1 Tax=Glossina austeni TaxID=7395 RepID=A0A1A9VE31_GLOAU
MKCLMCLMASVGLMLLMSSSLSVEAKKPKKYIGENGGDFEFIDETFVFHDNHHDSDDDDGDDDDDDDDGDDDDDDDDFAGGYNAEARKNKKKERNLCMPYQYISICMQTLAALQLRVCTLNTYTNKSTYEILDMKETKEKIFV